MDRKNNFNKNEILNKLPSDVKKDMSKLLNEVKGKSKEEKIKAMINYKKAFDKKNIDENLKAEIAEKVENSLSEKEKNIIKEKYNK